MGKIISHESYQRLTTNLGKFKEGLKNCPNCSIFPLLYPIFLSHLRHHPKNNNAAPKFSPKHSDGKQEILTFANNLKKAA